MQYQMTIVSERSQDWVVVVVVVVAVAVAVAVAVVVVVVVVVVVGELSFKLPQYGYTVSNGDSLS